MTRPPYSEYVRHALRFYTRSVINSPSEKPFFRSDIDETNWSACHSVLEDYSECDRKILTTVYAGYDTLPDEVYRLSKQLNINQNTIWDMMKAFERKVAKKRGLIE